MLPDLSAAQAELLQLPALKDNYIYLLRDEATDVTAVIDPADADTVSEALAAQGWGLDMILCTHHHGDHTGGNLALKERTGCRIIGFGGDAHRIPGIDQQLEDGGSIAVGRFPGQLICVPGHTLGHVAYYFPALRLLFCGDTLFSAGCGRLFEGTAAQMMASLQRLAALPEDTWVCCAHEYSESNTRFALSVEPENPATLTRLAEVGRRRAAGLPTVPTLLAQEKCYNPFLRAHSPQIRRMLGMKQASDEAVFAELRRRKDNFS